MRPTALFLRLQAGFAGLGPDRRGYAKIGAMVVNGWHRVTFPAHSDEYTQAVRAAVSMGMAASAICATRPTEHLSIWSVDETNARIARERAEPVEPVPDDLDLSRAYLYFSPGAADAFRSLLPPRWNYEACERPPVQLVQGLRTDTGFEHFRS
jgi:hypothetical protein